MNAASCCIKNTSEMINNFSLSSIALELSKKEQMLEHTSSLVAREKENNSKICSSRSSRKNMREK